MQKTRPSLPRLAVMVVFALSCFGILTFLWMSFGGSAPLKPKRYRFEVAFAKAFQLPEQAPVREAGVPIGKVVDLRLDGRSDKTLATIELDARYAPIHHDARAMLRTKSVAGETYVVITHGTRGSPALPDGGRLADSRVNPVQTVEDVFQIFKPRTRSHFRAWQRDLSRAVNGRGSDLNDSFAQLPALTSDADRTLATLDGQRGALSGLIRNSATTFGALSADARALRTTVSSFDTTLTATASQDDALARTFELFPGFLAASRSTLRDLDGFAVDADPLVTRLRPAIAQLPPALHQARLLAPDLRTLYEGLGPAFTAARTGLPATSEVLDGLEPVFEGLAPFLQELNPVLQWLELNQANFSDFFSEGLSALASRLKSPSVAPSIGHYLRQIDPGGAENSVLAPTRAATNRGNGYVNQLDLGPIWQQHEIYPTFDCANTGGEHPADLQTPACLVQSKRFFQGRTQGQYPHVNADSYSGKGGG